MPDSVRGPYTEQFHPPYRTGIVAEIESVPPYRVRVQFPDQANVLSWWLPIQVPKTQNDKFFWQPDIGEQVSVLMDEWDENGIVTGGVPSTVDAAPAGLTPADYLIQFEDGTTLHYNRTSHQLTVTMGSGGQLSITNNGMATDALALVSKLVTAFNTHTHGRGPGPDVPWTPSTVQSAIVKVSN